MNSYGGLHAAHYDLVYADKPYAAEARWIAAALAAAAPAAVPPGPLLDVACGTGRHALAFAELGFRVTGVDYNDALLEHARARARASGREVEFVHADMRELALGDGAFAAVTCLFDSIGYPVADEGIVAALAGLARHLAPDGAAAVEFLHAPAFATGFSPTRVRRWPTADGGELVRVAETAVHPAPQRMAVDYDLLELRADGTYARSRERQENRLFEVAEMQRLLEAGGLEAIAFLPAYEDGDEVGDDAFHVVAIATRR